MSEVVPPPWDLNGSGIVLLYRFPASFIRRWAPDVPAQRDQIGAVMCVRYSASGVGPYHELLFIPGRVAAGGQRGWTISRIYVSTQASVASGIANWAIPKQLADFSTGPDLGHFSALLGGSPFFSIDSQSYGPPLPASSAWLPAPPAIIQASEGGWKRTTPSARRGAAAAALARHRRRAALPAYRPAQAAAGAGDLRLHYAVPFGPAHPRDNREGHRRCPWPCLT